MQKARFFFPAARCSVVTVHAMVFAGVTLRIRVSELLEKGGQGLGDRSSDGQSGKEVQHGLRHLVHCQWM